MGVATPGFEQQNSCLHIFAQSIGKHTTGGTGPNDDVVKCLDRVPQLPVQSDRYSTATGKKSHCLLSLRSLAGD